MNRSATFPNIQTEKEIKDSFSIGYAEGLSFTHQLVCRLNYHRIFLITQGAGSIQIDGVFYPVTGNELFLLAKGQCYKFEAGTVITGFELCFGDCFWDKTPPSANNCKAVLFNNATANQHVFVGNTDMVELDLHFRALQNEFIKTDYINKPDVLAAYLKIIMIKIANLKLLLTDGQESHDNQLYRQFLELVSKKYQSTHEVNEFATLLGISTRKLTDICNKCGGNGAKDIINGQLIAEAKRALQFSNKPVKEIAFQLNFATPDHFSHFFKKNTQVSPFQYRSHFAHIGM
ncbi:helix-turn-helix domain-containing protein [Mucilaginibacter dorajii]|uniref:HTH araC/xylS-type domain-containing protein n=1 Tax=Mucilaginibacter dorajii TaxID=692994 RepID=A0ABP7P308_9SPHI|nr:AraC family transcriptional regulator [Mucilaginibacter dorajii]MCS3734329.1 AraC-like DNA-binding protein [Mucilaginibacter dorajii]